MGQGKGISSFKFNGIITFHSSLIISKAINKVKKYSVRSADNERLSFAISKYKNYVMCKKWSNKNKTHQLKILTKQFKTTSIITYHLKYVHHWLTPVTETTTDHTVKSLEPSFIPMVAQLGLALANLGLGLRPLITKRPQKFPIIIGAF